MTPALIPFREVLERISDFSSRGWLYLPEDEEWTLDSRSAVLRSEEVPRDLEDDPDAGVPAFAKRNKLMEALLARDVKDIIENAKAQRPDVSLETLLEAFLYYYDNDAYMTL